MILLVILCIALISCSSEQPLHEASSEYIYRKDGERRLNLGPLKKASKKKYPWTSSSESLPFITKDYFRCKGSSLNPPIPHQIRGKDADPLRDCDGAGKHSLPLRGNQEFIYPILIDLLNHIQAMTQKMVIISSGHRCPMHNTYIDPAPKNAPSKHTIGAEVDFYVRGFENKPERIVQMIQEYYRANPKYAQQKEYLEFQRFEKNTDVSCKPWYNKEIFIKLYSSTEGRNGDNRHSYPYIAIQVRFCRDRNLRVNYSWEEAQRLYQR